MRKRFTVHYMVAISEGWATWFAENEEMVEEEFLIEYPQAEILSIEEG